MLLAELERLHRMVKPQQGGNGKDADANGRRLHARESATSVVSRNLKRDAEGERRVPMSMIGKRYKTRTSDATFAVARTIQLESPQPLKGRLRRVPPTTRRRAPRVSLGQVQDSRQEGRQH